MRFTSEFQRNNHGRENREKETKEYTIQNIQIQVKHINGKQSSSMPIAKILKSWFNSNSEFGCIWLSLVLLLWDFWWKNICLQQATFQSPRTTHGMTTAKNVGTAGWIFFTNLHVTWRHTTIFVWFTPSFMHSHMVTSYRFLGGPYRFTWFGAFFNTIGPSLTKVVYAYFDGSSYVYSWRPDLWSVLKYSYLI